MSFFCGSCGAAVFILHDEFRFDRPRQITHDVPDGVEINPFTVAASTDIYGHKLFHTGVTGYGVTDDPIHAGEHFIIWLYG